MSVKAGVRLGPQGIKQCLCEGKLIYEEECSGSIPARARAAQDEGRGGLGSLRAGWYLRALRTTATRASRQHAQGGLRGQVDQGGISWVQRVLPGR